MESPSDCPSVVLSFDVEEHDRIEAAAGLECPPSLRREYADRMERTTRRLLDTLDEVGAKATFFVLGEIARARPRLVRDIAEAGHEVASHGWDHRRVHLMSPLEFLDDVRASKDVLEQASGGPVVGYRARRSASDGGPDGPSTRWPRRATSTIRRSSPYDTIATACRTRRGRRSWPRASPLT